MTDPLNNPWNNMFISSGRRIDTETNHNIFWILDDGGRAGIRISFKTIPAEFEDVGKFSGISMIIRYLTDSDDELYLILNNSSDKEIFHTLCSNLISIAVSIRDETQMFIAILKRLKHWQRFLSQVASKMLSEQVQMGLYGELIFLIECVMPTMSDKDALLSWVGPDFHKQDFSFENSLVEIKTFISSNGPFIKISSMHQLIFELKPLTLVVYGLTKNNTGRSIIDLIKEIKDKFTDNHYLLDIFESKLALYGYLDGISEGPFFKYFTDTKKAFEVNSEFPKITPKEIANQIVALQYTIDLSKCSIFETNINAAF